MQTIAFCLYFKVLNFTESIDKIFDSTSLLLLDWGCPIFYQWDSFLGLFLKAAIKKLPKLLKFDA